jgi:hypothetical protein
MDVALSEDEANYRGQLSIREWRSAAEFALPRGAKSVEVYVQGKRLAVMPVARNNGEGGIVRIPYPGGSAGVGHVEFRYRGPVDLLEAPSPVGGTVVGGSTWVITGRPGYVALVPGRTSGSWSPEAFLSTLGVGTRLPGWSGEPATVLQQSQIGPVAVYQAPKYTWLLSWSIAAVAVSLGLALLGRRTRSFVVLVGALALAAAVFLLPQPASRAVFAAVPGGIAVALLALVFRWARMRYRRRMSRAFGFARPGSSLIRPSVTRLREATTGEAAVVPATAPTSS